MMGLIKPTLFKEKNKFTSHNQYSFGPIFCGNPKKTHKKPSVQRVLLLCIKRNDSQTFKSKNCKNLPLQRVCRRVAESFSGWLLFSKFMAGLLKYYMLNVILDLFKVPSYEYMCK